MFVALEDLQRMHLRLVSRVKETTGVDHLIAAVRSLTLESRDVSPRAPPPQGRSE